MNLQATLYFRNATSDKVYFIELKESGDGYVVDFAYGRRGSTLKTGTKTQKPVPYAEAKEVYNRLLAEKTSKGYSPGEDGLAYVQTEHEGRISGVQCQLLNPIEETELEKFVTDPAWCFQEKHDGKRMLIRCLENGLVEGINRKGLVVGIPSVFATSLANVGTPVILDGEAVGEKLFVFDILQFPGANDDGSEDVRSWNYADRIGLLKQLESKLVGTAVEIVPTAQTKEEKEALVQRLKTSGKEGLVIKRLDAPYAAGRPASGGNQLKYKFTESVSCVVVSHNQKRSVNLGLLDDDGTLVEAGSVTILPNFQIPPLNSIVEVRYLYAHAQSGKLYQPVYLGERDDIEPIHCRKTQLKFKAPIEDDEG